MHQITFRVTDENLALVRRLARQRQIPQAEIWRELVDRGIHRSDPVTSQLEQLSKLVVQALCMGQRVAGHLDEELIEQARDDARLLIARMMEARELRKEGG